MYEQFSIDSKLLKPNISILKNYEDKNSRINSFSIKGSMIENPVGDIDIVDKKHLIQNKGRDTSSNNTLRFNQNFSGSSFSQNEEMQNKMNLSHIKISSTSINQSIINNTNFNSKSNLAISPSPSTTNDTNKIILNNQHNPNYKKGMFSYPKINNTPVVVQGNLPNNIIHEKPSFLNVLNRPPDRDKDKSTINTFSQYSNTIHIGKEDVMSQRSDSTSKFDMNKFKIGNKLDSKTFENTINNKSNFELASARQTINSGLRSPITQTIENNNSISYNNLTPQTNNNIHVLNVSNDNIVPKKNNFSKYLINDSSQKENRSNHTASLNQHNISNLTEKENSLNNVNFGEQRNSIPFMDQSYLKSQQSVNNHNIMNNVVDSSHDILNSNSFKQNVNNLSKNDVNFKKNENEGKAKNNKIANLQYQHEFENRRMTLELIKIILRTNPSHKNNPKTVLKELNFGTELLDTPTKVSFKSTNKGAEYKTSIFPPKTIQEVQQISSSLEIKNNNFEINNYYGNYTKNNNEEEKKSTMMNVSKIINKTNIGQTNPSFNLNENSEEKLKWLTNLITPRVMSMKYADKSIPFIFKLVPTDFCFTYGLEHYILEFESLSEKKEKGNIDLLKINHCTMKGDSSFTIALDSGKEELEYYEILPQDKATANMYVQSINYISQLIKCKFYAKTMK